MNNQIMCELIEKILLMKGENNYEQELCWEEFYNACVDVIRMIVRKKNFTFDAEWSQEDFEQDVMFKVLNKLDTYDSECGQFSTWLSSIINRTYYKKYNRAKREMEKGFSVIPMMVENAENNSYNIIDYYKCVHSIEKEFFYDSSSKKLYDAISNLKDNYRVVVLLCDIQGLKPKEVSKLLGCKSDDVYRWLNRAHSNLKNIINNEEIMEDLTYDEYEI